jgi:hypothetical protein
MIWALLAAYLTKRPPWVQALVFGLCVGLFVATAAEANERDVPTVPAWPTAGPGGPPPPRRGWLIPPVPGSLGIEPADAPARGQPRPHGG